MQDWSQVLHDGIDKDFLGGVNKSCYKNDQALKHFQQTTRDNRDVFLR